MGKKCRKYRKRDGQTCILHNEWIYYARVLTTTMELSKKLYEG